MLVQCQGFLPSTPPPASRLGVDKNLEGDTAGTADLSWPKGYPIPYNVMFSNKLGGSFSKVAVARWLAGLWSAGGGWWVIAFASLLDLVGFFFLLHLLKCLYLDLQVFLGFCPFDCLPPSNCGGASEWLGRGLAAVWDHPTTLGELRQCCLVLCLHWLKLIILPKHTQ